MKGVVLDTHLRSVLPVGECRGMGRRLIIRCDRGILLIPAGRGISGLLGGRYRHGAWWATSRSVATAGCDGLGVAASAAWIVGGDDDYMR